MGVIKQGSRLWWEKRNREGEVCLLNNMEGADTEAGNPQDNFHPSHFFPPQDQPWLLLVFKQSMLKAIEIKACL